MGGPARRYRRRCRGRGRGSPGHGRKRRTHPGLAQPCRPARGQGRSNRPHGADLGHPMSAPAAGATWTPDEIAGAGQLACLLEASAPKPGNVFPGRPFADMRFEDFVLSAVAIGPVMRDAGTRTLGDTILRAVEATRRVTAANTNLGMVLLLAPLARAAAVTGSGLDLRDAVWNMLAMTTVGDAERAYEAIRLAAPGGLGEVPGEDVSSAPTRSLLEVMRLAAD